MTKPKISIIVPVYNQEQFLKRSMESILGQTFRDFEVLLINDGSTDKSGPMCDEFASTDERVRVIHQENRGLSGARNTGLDHAVGELIMFCDSDDEMLPTMAEALLDTMDMTDADIVQCSYTEVFPDGRKPENVRGYEMSSIPNEIRDSSHTPVSESEVMVRRGKKKYSFIYESWGMAVVQWNKLYRRHIFNDLRNAEGRLHEDEWIIHYELEKAEKVATLYRHLHLYYRHDASITHQPSMKRTYDAVLAHWDRYEFFIKKRYFLLAARTYNRMMSIIENAKCGAKNRDDAEKWLPQIIEIGDRSKMGRASVIILRMTNRALPQLRKLIK